MLLVLSRVNTRSKISNPIQTVAEIFSELNYSSRSILLTSVQVQKRFPYIKTYLTVQLTSFYLTFNGSDLSATK